MKGSILLIAALLTSVWASLTWGVFSVAHAGHLPSKTSNPVTQCVQCEVRSGCWACVGGGQADSCPNVNCEECTVRGLCEGGINRPSLASAKPSTPVIKLDAETIRDIAKVHPRFAATLAKLSRNGISGDYYMYWTPVQLEAEDIEFYLADRKSRILPKKLDRKVRRLNQLIENGELQPIIYRIWVDDGSPSGPVVRLRVVNGGQQDPPYTSLEVKVISDSAFATARQTKAEWKIE